MHQIILSSCRDILEKNMEYAGSDELFLLYDRDSPLADILSSAYIAVLEDLRKVYPLGKITIKQFENPPQPLYRGGMINPDNPHVQAQNRVITSHNVTENIAIGLDHHKKIEVTPESLLDTNPQIEEIKNMLTSLPKNSIVILVQSTNFRLSTFRIRLELFHRGVHVIEHNHLAYIPEEEFETFYNALAYRTDEYVRLQNQFSQLTMDATETKIVSSNGSILSFGTLENIRGNTGDYTGIENKGGTFPIGEVFTEAKNLESVHGTCLVETFPNEDFSINICDPFEIIVEKGRVLPSSKFPAPFKRLYDLVVQFEGEVMVRELGFGLNPAISTATPLSDINFHERKVGVHLSLGKKHGIYGKKLPKNETQRFHIDVFVSVKSVFLGQTEAFREGVWII